MLGAAYPDMSRGDRIHSGAGYLAGEHGCPAHGSAVTVAASARAALVAMGSRAGRHAGHRLPRRPRWHRPVSMRPAGARSVAGHGRSSPPAPTPRSARPTQTETRHSSVANDHAYTVLSYPRPAVRWRSSGPFTVWATTGQEARPIRPRPVIRTRSAPTRVRPRGHSSPTGGGPGARPCACLEGSDRLTRCVSALKSHTHARKAPDQPGPSENGHGWA